MYAYQIEKFIQSIRPQFTSSMSLSMLSPPRYALGQSDLLTPPGMSC